MFLGGGIFGFGGQTSEVLNSYRGILHDSVGRIECVGACGDLLDSRVSMRGGGCGCGRGLKGLVLEHDGGFGGYI